jgi:hypothetical protein
MVVARKHCWPTQRASVFTGSEQEKEGKADHVRDGGDV